MKENNVIEIRNVSKNFKIYHDKGKELKERLLFKNRNTYEKREVLKGISFDIRKGEAIGLIGKNGCGKSTLLKLLNKIIYPTSGSINITGRVSSLIELGAGFHPDMSGRENIYTNASIFGLNKKEINSRIEKIITFSELEEFIDNPVRTYSSGMYMRLAFSVAINVDADILLIDEILAVGDVNFQNKCFEKLMEIKNNGTTIVIVSHSLNQIEAICDRSIWIEDGYIRETGVPKVIHERYLESMEDKRKKRIKDELEGTTLPVQEKVILPEFCNANSRRYGSREMEFLDVYVSNSIGIKTNIFHTTDDIIIYVKYDTKSDNERINIGFRINREDGVTCYGIDYTTYKGYLTKTKGNFFTASGIEIKNIIIKENSLLRGKYYLDVILSKEKVGTCDEICRVLDFEIDDNYPGIGIYKMNVQWMNEKMDKSMI